MLPTFVGRTGMRNERPSPRFVRSPIPQTAPGTAQGITNVPWRSPCRCSPGSASSRAATQCSTATTRHWRSRGSGGRRAAARSETRDASINEAAARLAMFLDTEHVEVRRSAPSLKGPGQALFRNPAWLRPGFETEPSARRRAAAGSGTDGFSRVSRTFTSMRGRSGSASTAAGAPWPRASARSARSPTRSAPAGRARWRGRPRGVDHATVRP